jgi:BirA family biotin operon repressor/biotin-[acetyl-CoA-carboxylase] ligase
VERVELACTLCARLEAWYERFLAGGPSAVVAAWRGLSSLLGARVRAGELAGVAEALEDDGALRLRLDDGRQVRIVAGEIE